MIARKSILCPYCVQHIPTGTRAVHLSFLLLAPINLTKAPPSDGQGTSGIRRKSFICSSKSLASSPSPALEHASRASMSLTCALLTHRDLNMTCKQNNYERINFIKWHRWVFSKSWVHLAEINGNWLVELENCMT